MQTVLSQKSKSVIQRHRRRLDDLEDVVFEDNEVWRIVSRGAGFALEATNRPVIGEVSCKILVNNVEVASLLCLNQQQIELALGFLYNEGVIAGSKGIAQASYNPAAMAVLITLEANVSIKRQSSLRSVTAGCGKCFTYISPQKHSQFHMVESSRRFDLDDLIWQMRLFTGCSEIYRSMGGVHSLLLRVDDEEFFSEDIGRHNCFDKVTGTLLRQNRLALAKEGVVYISGRVTSEIMTKAIRLGVPVIVSKSTPSVSAIKLANAYNITLLGYVSKSSGEQELGFVYSGMERLNVAH